jgi:peptidoglycan/xylan/chitin deacetylase (PgdA/CDA1 family)
MMLRVNQPLPFVLVLGVTAIAVAGVAADQPAMKWPGGRQAAIVLTYDDALRSHLDVALPQLDAAGFKGTFFLSGTLPQEDVQRWRKAAAAGHELGNHSVFHPCAKGTFEMPEQYTNERYSVKTMLAEIRVMNTLLHAIDGVAEHTFATPCGQTVVGGEDYISALRTSGLVKYVRAAGPPTADGRDPFNVPSMFFPDTVTGVELIAFVEATVIQGGLGVMGFHGVGGDYLTVSADAHQQLVQYLKAHQDAIWVATFREAMDYTQKVR